MHDSNDDKERERRLIEAAETEADELLATDFFKGPPRDAAPGFELLDEIGRGGMGVVYRARQLSTRRVTALKIMLSGWFASPSARRRFKREIALAARFRHPGIVHVLESGFTRDGHLYYAMDFIEGRHLDRWLKIEEANASTTTRLFIRVCEAVQHAHDRGVIHRDLKPANILVDAEGAPHVLDFGLSKAIDLGGDDSLATTVSLQGHAVGTPRYMSPEAAEGRIHETDARTDVYALGVMLYEALTGASPFGDKGSSSILTQKYQQEPLKPSAHNSQIDRELETIIMKAIESDREQRYQTASGMGEDLGRYLAGEPLAARPASRMYRLRRRISQQRGRIMRGAAVIVAAATALGLIAWRFDQVRNQRELQALSKARSGAIEAQHFLDMKRGHDASENAQVLLGRRSDLTEAYLVWVKARFEIAEQTTDESLRDLALQSLRGQIQHLELKGKTSETWALKMLLAECYAILGRPDAEQIRAEAEAAAPDDADSWLLRSLATFDSEESLRCAKAAVERDDSFERGWRRLAYLYESVRDWDSALEASEKLADLGDGRRHWEQFKGRILAQSGRFDEAAAHYDRLLAEHPDAHAYYKAYGAVALCLKHYEKAAALYAKAATLDVQEMWARYARATPLWILGRHAEAEEDYRRSRHYRGQVSYADARLYLVMRDHVRRLAESGEDARAEQLLADAEDVLMEARLHVMSNSQLQIILNSLAGETTPEALADPEDKSDIESMCERYYYAGESCLIRERYDAARYYFRKCVETDLAFDLNSTKLDAMNEYHLATWRLDQLGERELARD